jgi:hypothetical protein
MENEAVAFLRRRTAGVLARSVGSEVLLLDTEADRIHQLNQTASLIWLRCDESGSAEEIARLLVERFEVDWDVAMEDVLSTLRLLSELNLVVSA